MERESLKWDSNRVQWVDIDSTVDSVCGTQEGAASCVKFKYLLHFNLLS